MVEKDIAWTVSDRSEVIVAKLLSSLLNWQLDWDMQADFLVVTGQCRPKSAKQQRRNCCRLSHSASPGSKLKLLDYFHSTNNSLLSLLDLLAYPRNGSVIFSLSCSHSNNYD